MNSVYSLVPPVHPLFSRFVLIVGLTCVLPVLGWAQNGTVASSTSLAKKMQVLMDKGPVKGAQFSIVLRDGRTGKTLYGHGANEKLHPASNTKLLTTAAALKVLGRSHRWKTDLVADTYENGVAENLYLVGTGDPRFLSENLWKLIDDARVAGLKKVSGDLVIDDSHFPGGFMAPGFNDKDQDSSYRAATGAVSLNFNSVVIRVEPGSKVGEPLSVLLRPDSGHIELVNESATTSRGRERVQVSARMKGDGTRIVVRGRMPLSHRGLAVRRRIDNPPMFTGAAARLFIERAGISIGGKLRLGKAPKKSRRLARIWSPNLVQVISDVNKYSNNFMAEHLVRTLGSKHGRAGNWKGGRPVVEKFLREEVGLDGFRYDNGSGLFGKTAFSARDMVDLLAYMQKQPEHPEYLASMAINGVNGTLRRRLKRLAPGTVRAKTGTLNGVVCLSGHLRFADGSPGLFSILMNRLPGAAWAIWKIQDGMVQAMVESRPAKKTK